MVEKKIAYMESKRGKNHDVVSFRRLISSYFDVSKIKAIQVAGTNGKGSTCQWLSTFLSLEGYSVGVFTSPHLVSHFERIRVNGQNISSCDWEAIYDQYFDLFESENFTMFEIDLFMAVAYFLSCDVDWMIMEVGLGGRLDATSALSYEASVVTNIGMDHMALLGNTLEEIAYEKAGVFDHGRLAVTTETEPSCLSVMKEVCPDLLCVSDFAFDVDLPLYQKKNLALAMATLQALGFSSLPVDKAVSLFSWPGRFMTLQKSPWILLDGAHNVQGIDALISSLGTFSGRIYFSVLQDKQAEIMIDRLKILNCPITLVHIDSYRLYPLESLGLPIISLEEMFEQIKTSQEDCLLCGSLYFVGDVLAHFSADLDAGFHR